MCSLGFGVWGEVYGFHDTWGLRQRGVPGAPAVARLFIDLGTSLLDMGLGVAGLQFNQTFHRESTR